MVCYPQSGADCDFFFRSECRGSSELQDREMGDSKLRAASGSHWDFTVLLWDLTGSTVLEDISVGLSRVTST